MTHTMADLVAAAEQGMDTFAALVAGVPYEAKGILFSEMYFLDLCTRPVRPVRVLESGRARGQSTLLLARIFPALPVISLEHDPASPDVAIAARRLEGLAQVDLRFGDATRLLPAMVQDGDVVLIDGPKGFASLRLAFRLLATGRVRMVFIHDVGVGTPERAFLETVAPETIYSDHPDFARTAHGLDEAAAIRLPDASAFAAVYPRAGYGYGLACLAWDGRINYRWRLLAAMVRGLRVRMLGR
ncbi:MAG: hypothetical protein H7838_03205 [Magnetococcus sp. DMHC-8]